DRFPDGWVRGVNQRTAEEGFLPARCLEDGSDVDAGGAGSGSASTSGGHVEVMEKGKAELK
ncbi:hypothetical protein HK104_000134, partial [Borealophlyctis nickersoniae]